MKFGGCGNPRCMYCLLVLYMAMVGVSYSNELTKSPPMGWMSWGKYRCNVQCDQTHLNCISESLFKYIADEFVRGGYADLGYQYIIIDDCWMEKERDFLGRLVPDNIRFPNGMKHLSDYIHKRGLKFGIYENYGDTTCEKYPGSKDHVQSDVRLFSEWEIDYLKLDGCFTLSDELDYGYPLFSQYLNKTGRNIVFSCSWPYYQEHIFNIMPDYKSIRKHCNLWRNYHDIQDNWQSIKMIINYYGKEHKRMASYSSIGHWNDPDMLMIGNSGLNEGQSRIQMAVWCILAAPLIMSNDLPNIPHEMKRILLNSEVIAVDQDPLGLQGGMYQDVFGDLKVWLRKVIPVINNNHSYAIAFVNLNTHSSQSIQIKPLELGLNYPYEYNLMDLFHSKDLMNITNNDNIDVTVLPMDVVFYKLTVQK